MKSSGNSEKERFIDKKWSITPFKINGKTNQVGGDVSSIEYVWHVHPGEANPSIGDKTVLKNWKEYGYKGNPFVIGIKNKKVSFYDENGILESVDYIDLLGWENRRKSNETLFLYTNYYTYYFCYAYIIL